MNILFAGTFDADYGRTRVLLRGLRENGARVTVCNGGVTGGIWKVVRLMWRYVRLPRQRWDCIFVAFPAQEVMLLTPFLFFFQKACYATPIVVDMLTSHYDGYILDRKKYSQQSWHARWYHWLDRTALRLADCAIVDSDANGRFFQEQFGAPAHKLLTVSIGTDDTVLHPMVMPPEKTGTYLVHFHGKFIPHQGIGTILRAAQILKEEPITFQIIGRGQDYGAYRKMADDFGLTNIHWIDSVPYEQLAEFINKADVCLGPMGGTGHFDRCAPNKIYEYMACGKPIIVGRSQALRGIGVDNVNMVFVNPADGQDLAEKILFLKKNTQTRRELGEHALADFVNLYTPQKIVALLFGDLQERHLLSRGGALSVRIPTDRGPWRSRVLYWPRRIVRKIKSVL